VGPAIAEPISPSAVQVLDGDTVQANGRRIRLVGFDTPESLALRLEPATDHGLEKDRKVFAKAGLPS
jgi:endonuclease YncB( thermonuclease family)